jgi:hypothetical protein
MGTQIAVEEKKNNYPGGLLISKDEDIKTSSVYVGYLILKELKKKKDDKISIYDIGTALKKKGITHGSQFVFGLIFLYSTGVIDFKEPYIYKAANND